MDRLTVNGNYTVQLKNEGNYEGEGTNTPGSTSIGDYPEALSPDRHYPVGRLQNFQRHKLRAWAIYDMNFGRGGSMSVSGLVRVDSGLAYSLAQRNVAPTATQRLILTAAGYPMRSVPRTCSSRRAAPRRSPIRPARYLGALQRAAVQRPPSVDQVRRLQPDEQPEAGRVQHDGEPERGDLGRQPRTAHRLHAGGDVRQGDRQHGHQPEPDGDSDVCADWLRWHQRQRRRTFRCDGRCF